jgi:hypothetical protein
MSVLTLFAFNYSCKGICSSKVTFAWNSRYSSFFQISSYKINAFFIFIFDEHVNTLCICFLGNFSAILKSDRQFVETTFFNWKLILNCSSQILNVTDINGSKPNCFLRSLIFQQVLFFKQININLAFIFCQLLLEL